MATTSELKTRRSPRIRNEPSTTGPGSALDSLFASFANHVTKIRVRRGQPVPTGAEAGETALVVRSGVVTVQLTLPDTPRQISAILFPGDILLSEALPRHASAALVASNAAEVWRLRWPTLEQAMAADQKLARAVHDALVQQTARAQIHAAAIGQLTGEQRVATYMTEVGLRLGLATQGGTAFDLPLGRREVADYLGLNADTLSRIMSKLRQEGLFTNFDRSRVLVRDWIALTRLTPAAKALTDLYTSRGSKPPLAKSA